MVLYTAISANSALRASYACKRDKTVYKCGHFSPMDRPYKSLGTYTQNLLEVLKEPIISFQLGFL